MGEFHLSLEHLGGSFSVPEIEIIISALQHGKITHLYLATSDPIYYGSQEVLRSLGQSVRSISWLRLTNRSHSRHDWDKVLRGSQLGLQTKLYIPMASPDGLDELENGFLDDTSLPVTVHRLSAYQLEDRFSHGIESHSHRQFRFVDSVFS